MEPNLIASVESWSGSIKSSNMYYICADQAQKVVKRRSAISCDTVKMPSSLSLSANFN